MLLSRKIVLLGLDIVIATAIFFTIRSHSFCIAILSTCVYVALSFAMLRRPISLQTDVSKIFFSQKSEMRFALLFIAGVVVILSVLYFELNIR